MNQGLDTGFQLVSLTLQGTSKEARINFGPGLNVVSGPSDTGKTFITQCIDYVFGASTPPKTIPETEGFTDVVLTLAPAIGEPISLSRPLAGSNVVEYAAGSDTVALGATHQPAETDTVSYLLLSLSGLDDRYVRINEHGKTRELSFRNVMKFILISEEAIIAERSPIETGSPVSRTAEHSVFRILLDGEDDASVIERTPPKDLKQQRVGKRQVLEDLLREVRTEINAFEGELTREAVVELIAAIDRRIASDSEQLRAARADINDLELDRVSTWRELRKVQSDHASTEELHRRFELLQDQYSSDLSRLEATAEAGRLLATLSEERCPVCGSEAAHHETTHVDESAKPEDVAAASQAEAEKVRVLLGDLASTLSASNHKREVLDQAESEASARLRELERRLTTQYQPKVDAGVAAIQQHQNDRRRFESLTGLLDRQDDLETRLANASAPVKAPPKVEHPTVRPSSLDQLAQHAEKLLRSWNFPDLARVTWNQATNDLQLGGKDRRSFGKGVRALTHSAFSLALLQHCDTHDRGHPGVVLLDSPLVVYREPDPDEEGDRFDVKDSFYRSLSSEFTHRQVIVFENEEPPDDLIGATHTAFTRTGTGRRGFI